MIDGGKSNSLEIEKVSWMPGSHLGDAFPAIVSLELVITTFNVDDQDFAIVLRFYERPNGAFVQFFSTIAERWNSCLY